MFEYKGYVIVQTDEDGFHDIIAYQNGRFAFQACTDSHLEDDELKHTVGESFTLRNGCGATRVAYGTSILLRTTSVVLDTVQKIFKGSLAENTLIDIEPMHVSNNGNSFAEGKCKCCGNRDSR